jgi:hypothetical protein
LRESTRSSKNPLKKAIKEFSSVLPVNEQVAKFSKINKKNDEVKGTSEDWSVVKGTAELSKENSKKNKKKSNKN